MWNRKDYPTAKDADENGDILILRNNGRKSIYNWENFCHEKSLAKDIGWMPLPKSDVPESISITIERGDRSWMIENNGGIIEIHDSRDPMGEPTIHALAGGPRSGHAQLFAGAVLSVLESEDDGGEGVAVNDGELQDFIDTLRGRKTEDNCCNELDLLKKSELSYSGVVDRLRRRISHLEKTQDVPVMDYGGK